eukprot:CAMPEP_0169123830 /NCGR_PEP_ID=MMETSP1015-20121227/33997_1 /TAXON_ID=342587 /ORGANISM="Karlodinium micrum, Strain CCMP2283" /LENGTH=72 /DNA_ID=CAMNT_0009187199 /DNA_START=487 /DNA_END=705 /DNA_ORIENTATION=+
MTAVDVEGETPIHKAAEGGHVEVLQTLLKHRADVHAEGIHGQTPVSIAFQYGMNDVIDFLLQSRGLETRMSI